MFLNYYKDSILFLPINTLAGLPTITHRDSSVLFITLLPHPTNVKLPKFTRFLIVEFIPIKELFPTLTLPPITHPLPKKHDFQL